MVGKDDDSVPTSKPLAGPPNLDGFGNKRALITGASGFIGSRLRTRLLELDCDVVAIRRGTSPPAKTGRSVVADYNDRDGLKTLIENEKPDFIFHVAGATKGVSYDDFKRANVMPTVNLIDAAAGHDALERFVMVSSLASYGPSTAEKPHHEDDERRPIEHYGRSKLEAERALEETPKLPWTVIRPSGVYGPGDGDYFQLFQEIERGRNVYFGNRDRWFSAIYVDDCVEGILASALTNRTLRKGYFLCDGVPVTWGRFQEEIVAASGKSVWTLNLPEFLVTVAAIGGEALTRIDGKPRLFNRQKALMGAQEAWTCGHSSAADDFGYCPQMNIERGVREALAWYRSEGWL